MRYQERTVEEIKAICLRLAKTTHSDEELKRRIAEELGYTGTIDVTSAHSEPNAQGQTMRAVMGMIWGPNGEMISF